MEGTREKITTKTLRISEPSKEALKGGIPGETPWEIPNGTTCEIPEDTLRITTEETPGRIKKAFSGYLPYRSG